MSFVIVQSNNFGFGFYDTQLKTALKPTINFEMIIMMICMKKLMVILKNNYF